MVYSRCRETTRCHYKAENDKKSTDNVIINDINDVNENPPTNGIDVIRIMQPHVGRVADL